MSKSKQLVLVKKPVRKFTVEVDVDDTKRCSDLEHYLTNHQYKFVQRGGRHGQKVKDEELREVEQEYRDLTGDFRFKMNTREAPLFESKKKTRVEIIRDRIAQIKAEQAKEQVVAA